MSISALGSVKGKCEARKRERTCCPNMRRAKSLSVPFRSPKVMWRPDRQPFDLVELHLRAGGDLLVAEAHPRQDDAHRRRVLRVQRGVLAHGADLPRRGVRAQQQRVIAALRAGVDVEGVLHLARRVVGREVEQLEVVLVRLHLARAVDLEAHLAEDAVDLAQRLGGGVQAAAQRRASRAG